MKEKKANECEDHTAGQVRVCNNIQDVLSTHISRGRKEPLFTGQVRLYKTTLVCGGVVGAERGGSLPFTPTPG